MAKFTEQQINSAIEAEVAHWAHGFDVTDHEEIEGRRRFHRANLAQNHIGCLIDFIAPAPSDYKLVGHVQSLRGRKGITAAYFDAAEVPDGTAVFTKIAPDENAFDHFQPIETSTAAV